MKTWPVIGLLCAGLATTGTYAQETTTMIATREPGTIKHVTVYAPKDSYAAFPCLMRTSDALLLEFGDQPLDALEKSGLHPHYAPVATPKYALSRDGGNSWQVTDNPFPLSSRLTATTRGDYYAATVLPGGKLLTMSLGYESKNAKFKPLTVEERTTPDGTIARQQTVTSFGPEENFNPFSITRTPDGSLLAAGYWYGIAFLRSRDEGKSWEYVTSISSPDAFNFSEPGLVTLDDGRIIAMLRADWDAKGRDTWPEEVNGHGLKRDGYGYYLYQSESSDNGKTWTAPKQLPIWGHPGFLLKLTSGNVLLVYGHRRPPFSVRAVLSRDGCRTWDLSTMKTVYTFEQQSIDMGYPVALQLEDGTICCAYYGFNRDKDDYSSRGIFASLFDEAWLTTLEATPAPAENNAK